MNLRLYQGQVPLVRVILPILLKMSRRARRLLQQRLKVLRNLGAVLWGNQLFKAFARNLRNERNAVPVSERLSDNARRVSFLREFQNAVFHFFW